MLKIAKKSKFLTISTEMHWIEFLQFVMIQNLTKYWTEYHYLEPNYSNIVELRSRLGPGRKYQFSVSSVIAF